MVSISRTSTSFENQSAINRMGKLERIISEKSRNISGERYATFDEVYDRSDFGVIADINRESIENETWIRNARIVQTKADVMSKSLKDIMSVAEDLSDYLVINGNYLTRDMSSLNILSDDMLDTVAHLLNIKVMGDYLFSGSKINVLPVKAPVSINFGDGNPASDKFSFFKEPNANYYSGDDVKKTVDIDSHLRVQYGITASDSAFKNIIAALNISKEVEGENPKLIARAGTLLKQGIEELSVLQMKLHTDSSLAGEVINRRMDYKNILNERQDMIDEKHGLDLMGLMVDYQQTNNTLNASMHAFTVASKLNILNYM